MDDATFLRNFSRRGRVVLLADGTALPAPISVLDDPDRAGAAFLISLVSPEGAESGDRRTFLPGTIGHRDLPLPLLWQWQLADGHKNAVVVGRIDHIERTEKGLGNARGVFDSGPWGREAERMVRTRMVRGVSGDYSSFSAKILEKIDTEDQLIKDDKIAVDASKLVAVTIVAKPAFEDCYIEILEDDQVLPNGIIEAPVVLTASALRFSGRSDLVDRLERLEQIEAEELSLLASATAERVNAYRLERERQDAVARIRGMQNLTAAWKPLSSNFLSAKAKLQPRDALGRWIDMGATVRWKPSKERTGGVQRGGHEKVTSAHFRQGRVKKFDPSTGEFEIEPLDGSPAVKLRGGDLENVKAAIPDTPEEAQRLADQAREMMSATDEDLKNAGFDTSNPSRFGAPAESGDGDSGLGLFSEEEAETTLSPEAAVEGAKGARAELDDAIKTAESPDDRTKEVGLERLSELLGAEIEDGSEPFQTNRQQRKAERKETAPARKEARQQARVDSLEKKFSSPGTPFETRDADGNYVGPERREGEPAWRPTDEGNAKAADLAVGDTFIDDVPPFMSKMKRKVVGVSQTDDGRTKVDFELADGSRGSTVYGPDVPLNKVDADWKSDDETDEPVADAAETDAAAVDPPADDAVQKLAGDLVQALQKAAADPADDPLAVADKAFAEGKQWGDAPKETPEDELEFDEKGSVQLKQGQSVSLTNHPKVNPANKPSEKPVNPPGGTSKKKSKKQQILDGDVPIPTMKGSQSGESAPPKGNWTEMAKTMFENLHPDSSWDEANQTEWIEAAKKAMETKNVQ